MFMNVQCFSQLKGLVCLLKEIAAGDRGERFHEICDPIIPRMLTKVPVLVSTYTGTKEIQLTRKQELSGTVLVW